MATGYKPPTPIVEFAPSAAVGSGGFSPLNKPAAGDWKALTISAGGATKSRLLSLTFGGGRADRYEQFDPGTATFEFDNSDGQLDEYKVGSLTEGNKGGALTPIRFSLLSNTGGGTKQQWSGFIDRGWQPSESANKVRTVIVHAVDWMGWAATVEMPKSLIGSYIASNSPNLALWWKGQSSLNKISSSLGGVLYDYNGSATVFNGAAISALAAESAGGIVPNDDGPAMRLFTGCSISSGANVSSASTWTVTACFQVVDTSTFGRDIVTCRTGSNTGLLRWRLRIGTNGNVSAEMYNASGVSVGSATILLPHNDGKPHVIQAQYDTLTPVVRIKSDLGSASGVVTAGSVTGGGWILTASTVNDVRVLAQHIAVVKNINTYGGTDLDTALNETSDGDLWNMDAIPARMTRLANISGVSISVDPVAGGTFVGGFTPSGSLAGSIQALSSSLGGGAFSPKTLFDVKVYGYADQSSGYGVSGDFDGAATFSNDAAAAPADTLVRYTGSGRTGKLIDRVINEVRSASGAVIARDQPSITKYGLQPLSLDIRNSTAAPGYAASIVTARKDPTPELGEVTVKPWGFQAMTDWVMSINCDLGRDVAYVELVPNGSAVSYFATLTIQSIAWDWSDGSDWSVTLKLA